MDFIIFITTLVVVYFIGTVFIEKRHFKSLKKREKELIHLPIVNLKNLDFDNNHQQFLVTGVVALSGDVFKQFVSNIIQIFGGRLTPYETLLDRARREAMLRMKESAQRQGATSIVNMRIETTSISNNNHESSGIVEVLVYGTAIK